jgi:hypothetical protein
MPIDDKKYKRLTIENVDRSPKRTGVYALYDAESTLIFLGEASGKTSLRSRLRGHLGAAPKGALRYKREPCKDPADRLRDLLREHAKTYGAPPRANKA